MEHISGLLSFLMAAALLAGCAAAGSSALSGMDVLHSKKPRAAGKQVPSDDLQSLADGNLAFAFDLYQSFSKGGNIFYSPYSISLALAMIYAGGRGETEQQIASSMHFSLPQDRLHPAFNVVDQQLDSRKNTGGNAADGKGFRFHIVNDLWGQKNYPFNRDYLDLLSENYGAGLRLVDFTENPEGSRQVINQYIAKQTGQRIPDLIPAGLIDSLTRLVLTNAIYFNAAWFFPFEPELTNPGAYTRLDGSQVEVSLMRMPDYEMLAYQTGQGYQAVALPYENSQLVMWILVPDEGHFAAFEAALDLARLKSIVDQPGYRSVRVAMPRFKIEDEFNLSETLKQLGMSDAFDPNLADFSGISSIEDLSISEVVHRAFIKVDEAGTEAAAATAVIMKVTSMPVDTIDLTIDRPFIFMIYDQPTQTVLFLGRVVEPVVE